MKKSSGCVFGQCQYDAETTLTDIRTTSSVPTLKVLSARRNSLSAEVGTLPIIASNNSNISDPDAEMYVCGQTVAWEYVWLLLGMVVSVTDAEMFHPG